jgi:hypothetical protein
VDVVTEGPNGELLYYYATPGSQFSVATIAGRGTTYSSPAIAVRSTGEVDVVAEGGADVDLTYYWAMPGSAWQQLLLADLTPR